MRDRVVTSHSLDGAAGNAGSVPFCTAGLKRLRGSFLWGARGWWGAGPPGLVKLRRGGKCLVTVFFVGLAAMFHLPTVHLTLHRQEIASLLPAREEALGAAQHVQVTCSAVVLVPHTGLRSCRCRCLNVFISPEAPGGHSFWSPALPARGQLALDTPLPGGLASSRWPVASWRPHRRGRFLRPDHVAVGVGLRCF